VFILLWFRFQRYGKKQYHETFLKIFFILFFISNIPYICIKSKKQTNGKNETRTQENPGRSARKIGIGIPKRRRQIGHRQKIRIIDKGR